MTEQEELIFGLHRYMSNARSYLGNNSASEIIKDHKSFDAICFCFIMIDEIIKTLLSKHQEIITLYPDIDFKKVATCKDRVFIGDNINYIEMVEIINNEISLIESKLISMIGAFKYGK